MSSLTEARADARAWSERNRVTTYYIHHIEDQDYTVSSQCIAEDVIACFYNGSEELFEYGDD